MVTIQHSSEKHTTNSLWNQALYHKIDYIDNQPIYHILSNNIPSNHLIKMSAWSFTRQSSSDIKQDRTLHRFSTRHRNENGQLPTQLSVNIPLIKSNNDIKLPVSVKFHSIFDSIDNSISQQYNDMKILRISVPLLNQYSLLKSRDSIHSFDSENELNEFNQMTLVCANDELFSTDEHS